MHTAQQSRNQKPYGSVDVWEYGRASVPVCQYAGKTENRRGTLWSNPDLISRKAAENAKKRLKFVRFQYLKVASPKYLLLSAFIGVYLWFRLVVFRVFRVFV